MLDSRKKDEKLLCAFIYFHVQLGSCSEGDIAGRVMTRILSHFPGERNQLLVDCGFTGITKQGFKELDGSFAIIQVE